MASQIKRLSLVYAFWEIVPYSGKQGMSTSPISYEMSIIRGCASFYGTHGLYAHGYARHIMVPVSYDGPLTLF